METQIKDVKKGDIVEFQKYRLRVEQEPIVIGQQIELRGRININGCPFVSRRYFSNLPVRIET